MSKFQKVNDTNGVQTSAKSCPRGASVQSRALKDSGKKKRVSRTNSKRSDILPDNNVRRNMVEGSNDPEWYITDEPTLNAVASLPFNQALGVMVDLGKGDNTSVQSPSPDSIPGIMSIGVLPTIGISNDRTDPINMATYQLYAKIRAVISGERPYDPADLMMFIIAGDSISTYYTFMCTIYGLISKYSFLNRYYAQAAVEALNVNYESVSTRLADFRAYINLFAQRANSIPCPTGLPVYLRHATMFSRLYTDSVSETSQTYVLRPEGWYELNTSGSSGTELHFIPWLATDNSEQSMPNKFGMVTLTRIMEIGNRLIQGMLLDSEILATIGGDMLKTFGESTWHFSPIDETFITPVVYDEEMLYQINNLVLVGGLITEPFGSGNEYNYTQNPSEGVLKFNPPFQSINPAVNRDNLLNIPFNVSPSPRLNMVMTRFMPVFNNFTYSTSRSAWVYNLRSCGTEIATTAYIVRSYINSAQQIDFIPEGEFYSAMRLNSGVPQLINYWDKFQYAPRIEWFTVNGEADSAKSIFNSLTGDLDYYSVISDETLSLMHQMALLKEFSVGNYNKGTL
nr:putative capsid [Marmot picobirnavirus]